MPKPLIDKAAFERMRQRMEKYDAAREQLIKMGRDALKASKGAIYALHRSETKTAKARLADARKTLDAMDKIIAQDAHLASVGAVREAREEYIEASTYAHFLEHGDLLSADELDADIETYLEALGDLCGELVRKAVNAGIAGDIPLVLSIRQFIHEIHDELMLFDLRNIPARKKYDSIKYGLEKLEDLVLQLKLKDKLED